tara:strand:+ start:197 stop:472 length:276 start_codon:yes stop_codon:yes gene_type:complete
MHDWKLSTLYTQGLGDTQRPIAFEIVGPLDGSVATVWVKQGRADEAEAKAQLLLNAPAMLEALRAIEKLAEINLQTGIKHIAQVAIKKATL